MERGAVKTSKNESRLAWTRMEEEEKGGEEGEEMSPKETAEKRGKGRKKGKEQGQSRMRRKMVGSPRVHMSCLMSETAGPCMRDRSIIDISGFLFTNKSLSFLDSVMFIEVITAFNGRRIWHGWFRLNLCRTDQNLMSINNKKRQNELVIVNNPIKLNRHSPNNRRGIRFKTRTKAKKHMTL